MGWKRRLGRLRGYINEELGVEVITHPNGEYGILFRSDKGPTHDKKRVKTFEEVQSEIMHRFGLTAAIDLKFLNSLT